MIAKLLTHWWFGLVLVLLAAMYAYGYSEMFFHQDDLDWFILVNQPLPRVMAYPVADHVNYLFRLLFSWEWHVFGFSFPPYLLVSFLLHLSVIGLLHALVRQTTQRADLAAYTALLFSVNTNWNEVLLWVSGQTISITAVFVLLAMYCLLYRRAQVLTLVLACLTSALALGLPVAAWLSYGVAWNQRRLTRLGCAIPLLLGGVGLIYWAWGGDGTKLAISPVWLLHVLSVWVLAPLHTVLGRLLIPFDSLEMIRLWSVAALLLIAGYHYRSHLKRIWLDQWSRFLFLQLTFYYLLVALGRAQYGVGIMRAERYAYLGLALGLLLAARILRKWRLGRWVWVIPLLLVMQNIGFYRRAQDYIVRPQQLKSLVTELKMSGARAIDPQDYLPYFVLNDERLRYRDLLPLLTH